MPVQNERAWEVRLNDDGDFLRFRVATDGPELIDFLVQLEVTVDGNRLPVVRYDGSHSRCHYDRYTRDGKKAEQRWLDEGLSAKDCQKLGEQDLKENWPRYRARYFEED